MKRAAFVSIALCCASPALADKYFAVTPSGVAEVLFAEKPSAAIGKLSSKCIDAHWTVTNSTETELTCEAPMNFGQSLLGQLAMGNSYSTPPRRFFRFNVASVNGISRVQASGWMELQMAFGQTRRTDFSGPEFQNNIIGFMTAAGGHFPPGTTFPNHAMLGVKGAIGPAGFQVTSVEPDLPAAKGGVQPGDLITTIANKKLKTEAQYLDDSAKAAETAAYPITIVRGGKTLKLTIDRVFRPEVTETVVAAVDPSSATQPAAAQLGAADELSKLAALKDKGVITADEFAAQKKKLLAN